MSLTRATSSRSLRSEISDTSTARLQRRSSIKSVSQYSVQRAEEERLREQNVREAEHRAALNRMFGFPEAPSKVWAIGKDGCAAVWWNHETYFEQQAHKLQQEKDIADAKELISSNTAQSAVHTADIDSSKYRPSSETGKMNSNQQRRQHRENEAEEEELELEGIETEDEDAAIITHWEVHRYRKDKVRVAPLSRSSRSIKGAQQQHYAAESSSEWKYKGFTRFDTALLEGSDLQQKVPQVLVVQLSNDFEYKFTVKAVNKKGCSAESPYSNKVMVEAPLPSGWNRFFDRVTGKYYYANIRTHMSSWTRPETDPYFLDEAIVSNFSGRELRHLRSLYEEEMAHFQRISVSRYLDVLRECGERATRRWLKQLIAGYGRTQQQQLPEQQQQQLPPEQQPRQKQQNSTGLIPSSTEEDDLGAAMTNWQHFMEVTSHIKSYRTTGKGIVAWNPIEQTMLFLARATQVRRILQPKRAKMGDWVVEYNALAERKYYRNTVTGEQCWSMPTPIKFYVPPRLEEKLLSVFSYGDIEEFQQFFALLDVDHSGDLSAREIKLLLRCLDIKITESKFSKLVRTVDLNGNGTIEFDEFCWMMYQIYRHDKSSFFGDLHMHSSHSRANQRNSGGLLRWIGFTFKRNKQVHPPHSSSATGAATSDGGGSEDGDRGNRHLRRSDSVTSEVLSVGSNRDLSVFAERNWVGSSAKLPQSSSRQGKRHKLAFSRVRKVLTYASKMTLAAANPPAAVYPSEVEQSSTKPLPIASRKAAPGIKRAESSISLNSQYSSNVLQFTNSVRNLLTGTTTFELEEQQLQQKRIVPKLFFSPGFGKSPPSQRKQQQRVQPMSRLNTVLSRFDDQDLMDPNFSPVRSIRTQRARSVGSRAGEQQLQSGHMLESEDFDDNDFEGVADERTDLPLNDATTAVKAAVVFARTNDDRRSLRMFAEEEEEEFLDTDSLPKSKNARQQSFRWTADVAVEEDSSSDISSDSEEQERAVAVDRSRRSSVGSLFSFGGSALREPDDHGQFCMCGCRRF